MSNQIWRFSYNKESLESIISSGKLHFPEINPHGPGKYNSIDDIVTDIKVGCMIILANFSMLENTAVVRAAGKVLSKSQGNVYIEWKKVVPSLSLHPHRIGAGQWERESVFLINAPRAKEFKLDKLKGKLFP